MNDQLSDIKEAMFKSENQGMKTFDSALYELARSGKITQEEALKNADSMNNLRLRFKLSKPLSGEPEPAELRPGKQIETPPAALSPAEEKRNIARLAAEKAKAKLALLKRAQGSKDNGSRNESANSTADNTGNAANDQARSQPAGLTLRPISGTGAAGGSELSLVIDDDNDNPDV